MSEEADSPPVGREGGGSQREEGNEDNVTKTRSKKKTKTGRTVFHGRCLTRAGGKEPRPELSSTPKTISITGPRCSCRGAEEQQERKKTPKHFFFPERKREASRLIFSSSPPPPGASAAVEKWKCVEPSSSSSVRLFTEAF